MDNVFRELTRTPDGLTVLFLGAIWFALFLFVCWIVKLLWNSTLPELFGFKRLTFWQSIKISLLVWILVGGPPLMRFTTG